MTSREERLQILKMVEEGKLSAQEGARLLEALEARGGPPQRVERPGRWLRVRVTHPGSREPNVNVSLPLSLVGAAGRLLRPYIAEYISQEELEELLERIRSPEPGKILDVQDESGEHVEIFVE